MWKRTSFTQRLHGMTREGIKVTQRCLERRDVLLEIISYRRYSTVLPRGSWFLASSRCQSWFPQKHRRRWHWTDINEPPLDASTCPGCGAPFQSAHIDAPGYRLRQDGHEEVKKAAKKTSRRRLEEDNVYESVMASLSVDFKAHLLTENAIHAVESDVSAMAETNMASNSDDTLSMDKDEAIPAVEYASASITQVVCSRCHSLRHHNAPTLASPTSPFVPLPATSMPKKSRHGVHLLAFDLPDFPKSLPPPTTLPMTTTTPLLLVGTKSDLLPSGYSESRLTQHIHRYLKEHRPDLAFIPPVHILSSHKNTGIRPLIQAIRDMRRPGEDVFILGRVNAGKSELVNAMLRVSEHGAKGRKLTKSWVPGTTMGDIRVPIALFKRTLVVANEGNEDAGWVVDTPGVESEPSVVDALTVEELRWLAKFYDKRGPQPVTFPLKPGGLMRLDHLGNDRNHSVNITVMSHLLPHVTNMSKADEDTRMLSTLTPPKHLFPPFPTRSLPLPLMTPALEFTSEGSHDTKIQDEIVLGGGLGWLGLTGRFPMTRWRVWAGSPNWVWLRSATEVLMPWEYAAGGKKKIRSSKRIRATPPTSLPPH